MKDLNKTTTAMLIWDVCIAIWDMALATYNFYKGCVVVVGMIMVACVVLLVWSVVYLLATKWRIYNLAVWRDKFFAYLKGLPNENENTGITD